MKMAKSSKAGRDRMIVHLNSRGKIPMIYLKKNSMICSCMENKPVCLRHREADQRMQAS